ncbi:MAG: hypothetical protein V3S42_04465 [Candidatus Neomarinimicrobiota bacterium]
MLNHDKINTDCCGLLIDIECATTCEFSNDVLCDECIEYIDSDLFDIGMFKILNEEEIKNREFILTSKKAASHVKRILDKKTTDSPDKIIDSAMQGYYSECHYNNT